MSRPILIRGIRQLLTLRGPSGARRGADLRNLGIIPDGAILVADGLIREVGPSRRLDNLAEARKAEVINATGKVVLPGFVDSHTHLVSGPARLDDYEMHLAGASRDQIAFIGGGLAGIHRAILDAPLQTLENQAWRIMQESVRQGTTTIEAKSGYGVTESGELKILRTHQGLNRHFDSVLSTLLCGRFLPSGHPHSLDEHVDWLASHLLPLVRRRKLAEFVDVFCEEGFLSAGQARLLLTRARELGFALKMHAGQHGNTGGVRLAVEMGALSVDHAIHLDQGDIDALAQSQTVATLLPGPVFYLGTHHYASARALIDRGAAVALATNYNAESCPTQNMQMAIALACRRMNMTPAEAISAATINGAYALGRGNRIGSLEFGKQADLIMLSVSDYRELPYYFGVNLVAMTMKRGRGIYQASEVQCPDR